MDPTPEVKNPAPPVIDSGKALPWIVYLVFFAVLNETVFNVSTPAIAKQFALSASGVSWVMTSFIVFFAMGAVIYGRLSDLFSLKRLIVIGTCLYAAGSAAGFLLQSVYPGLVAARAVQGAGASAIPALVMVIVARYFPASARGKVFGTITSVVAFASGTGPVIGGFVASTFGWPFLFVIPLFTLVSIPFLNRLLPDEQRRPGSVDILGAFLVAAGIAGVIFFLSFSDWYWLAGAAAALGLLVLRIRTARQPFIDPALFRNARFRAGLIVGFIVFSSSIGIIFVIPLLFSSLYGLSTGAIGLFMFPGAISGVLFGRLGGVLADRRGNRLVMAIGIVLLVASLGALFLFLGVSPWLVSGALLLTYIGFTLAQTALINSVSQTLAVEQTGVGMGLFNLGSFMAAAIGTAGVARVLAGGWLNLRLSPLAPTEKAAGFSNLMLVFAALVTLGAVIYFSRYPNPAKTTASAKRDDRPADVEARGRAGMGAQGEEECEPCP